MGCGTSKNGTAGAVARGGGGSVASMPGAAGEGKHWSPGASSSSGVGRGGDLRYNMLKANVGGGRFHEVFQLQKGTLGEAAMGCVVRGALKTRTGEMFACKTFMVSSVPKKKAQKRILETLRNEIDLLRSLDHPNIVRAYESYEVGQDLHVIMELCRGGDLGARTYTEPQAAAVVRQVLSAILHAHKKGICHRDLKFENILWESDAPHAQIKLIDFGMSARFQEGMPMNERVGTVYTMAPEVLQGEYTKQADLWSVGCITFHLIAGEPPFECEDEVNTMKRLLAVSYFWPPGSKVSSEAKAFVYNLLKFDPRRRWTVEQAIASPWIKRFSPGGPDADPTPAPTPTAASAAQITPSTIGSTSSSSLAATATAAAAPAPAGGPSGAPAILSPSASSTAKGREAGVKRHVAGGGPGARETREGCEVGAGAGTKVTAATDADLNELPRETLQLRMLSSMRDYRSYGALRRTALMVVAYNQAPEKLRDLRNEFVEIDTERDGKISRREMEAALAQRGVAPEEIEELFKSLDVDQSGDIHYLEFLAATIEAVGVMEEDRLQLAFERLDTDESGFITVDNFKEVVGPSYDDDAIRKTLEEADIGKDGHVGWDEFLLLMRSHGTVKNVLVEEMKAVDDLKDMMSPKLPSGLVGQTASAQVGDTAIRGDGTAGEAIEGIATAPLAAVAEADASQEKASVLIGGEDGEGGASPPKVEGMPIEGTGDDAAGVPAVALENGSSAGQQSVPANPKE